MLTRRATILSASALGLSACLPTGGGTPPEATRAVANPAFDAWLDGFRGRAVAQGITVQTLDRGLSRAGFLPGVIERDRNQTEFTRTTEDYLAIVASEDDVAEGRQAYARQRNNLEAVSARFGVQPEILAAFWGVESRYGTRIGDFPVISATATLAFDGRRGRFFEAQLLGAMQIIQAGDTTPDRMVGSWAGAMGHTQQLPTVFLEYGVDFRGDGRRDIWGADPTDGLATTANYMVRYGWQPGAPWGMEVAIPPGFDTGQADRRNRQPVSTWRAAGITRPGGGAVPDHGPAAIHAPAGAGRPGFILYQNFNVIRRYNPSTNYAIGVGYLADRIAGAGPLQGDFGTDATGLTQAQRRELQARLNRLGYDVGTPDGVVGRRTEAAISAFQRDRGLAVTGQPSPALLAALGG